MSPNEVKKLTERMLALVTKAQRQYPPVIVAHYFAAVIIPGMCRAIGVKETSEEFAKLLARGMALHTGVCTMCLKADSIAGEDVCARCLADFDQFCAEIDEHVKDE